MAQVRMAAITDEPISVDQVLAALDDPASGAAALFVGRVRDHDAGRGVVGLTYEQHPSAGERLADVAHQVADQFDAVVAAIHRVGPLEIGDIAVVVGAATPHRGEGFEACRALIDTLKAQVPIWKHQRFSDGSEQWVGTP